MTDQPQSIRAPFSITALRGSPYEIGVQQAHQIAGIPGFVDYLRSGQTVPGDRDTARVLELLRHHCPNLVEECTGLCDTLQIPADQLVYYAQTYLRPAHCSHFIIGPAATADGRLLVGRNYDFSEKMDDLRLCWTQPTGSYAHLGFSAQLFGRVDGMNEHGLTVTMSGGGIPMGVTPGLRPPLQEGLQFWALIRTVLERCKTVAEALDCFRDFPFAGNPIFLFADAAGHAARAEAFGAAKAIQELDGNSPEPWLIAVNHYHAPELRRLDPGAMQNSLHREQLIQARLQAAAPQITAETLKTLLSTRYPEGLCCHYYPEFFGTLHSLVFDPQERRAEFAYGSPAVNSWNTLRSDTPLTPDFRQVELPYESADPTFWQFQPIS